jgi:hypothetical protein
MRSVPHSHVRSRDGARLEARSTGAGRGGSGGAEAYAVSEVGAVSVILDSLAGNIPRPSASYIGALLVALAGRRNIAASAEGTMGWFSKKGDPQRELKRYVDAVLNLSVDLYLRTPVAPMGAQAWISLSAPEARFRYLMLCFTGVCVASASRMKTHEMAEKVIDTALAAYLLPHCCTPEGRAELMLTPDQFPSSHDAIQDLADRCGEMFMPAWMNWARQVVAAGGDIGSGFTVAKIIEPLVREVEYSTNLVSSSAAAGQPPDDDGMRPWYFTLWVQAEVMLSQPLFDKLVARG